MTESPFDSPFPASAPPTSELALSRRGALALGALAGVAALTLPRLPARALNMGLASQMRFLENAQYLQNQFFTRALESPALDDLTPQDTSIISTIAREDGEQARWFRAARGRGGLLSSNSTLPASLTAPTFAISSSRYAKRDTFFESAIALKNATIGAYHGIVGAGGNPEIVQAIAALAGVQNRHVALLCELAGRDPFVTYVEPLSLQQAGSTLSKFGLGTEVRQ